MVRRSSSISNWETKPTVTGYWFFAMSESYMSFPSTTEYRILFTYLVSVTQVRGVALGQPLRQENRKAIHGECLCGCCADNEESIGKTRSGTSRILSLLQISTSLTLLVTPASASVGHATLLEPPLLCGNNAVSPVTLLLPTFGYSSTPTVVLPFPPSLCTVAFSALKSASMVAFTIKNL